jgi:DNA polymerase V
VRARVPEALAPSVATLVHDYRLTKTLGPVPVVAESAHGPIAAFVANVPAGFPSPAEQYLEEDIDLHAHLVPAGHEAATFVIRVRGWSMTGAGIHDGDELIVDRAAENPAGKVVVAAHNGEMTVKRLRRRGGSWVLLAENPDYPDRVVAEEDDFELWGVVVRVLHVP